LLPTAASKEVKLSGPAGAATVIMRGDFPDDAASTLIAVHISETLWEL
jgi:hypothetical protein